MSSETAETIERTDVEKLEGVWVRATSRGEGDGRQILLGAVLNPHWLTVGLVVLGCVDGSVWHATDGGGWMEEAGHTHGSIYEAIDDGCGSSGVIVLRQRVRSRRGGVGSGFRGRVGVVVAGGKPGRRRSPR
jgi:hypothetical protein